MSKQQIGVIGMAVMGRNLALNIERNSFSVSIYNRSDSVTKLVVSQNPYKKLFPFYSIKEFIFSLEKPRCVLLMVKSGTATDHTIKSIISYLEKGDIIIDGGNTYYKDTIRRYYQLSKIGLNLIGAGISGGEKGALEGPSIMPGGKKQAYDFVYPILKKIAAVSEGQPCVSYIGSDGSGHYVKMVHNGIEYGDMQLISESYFLLKLLLNIDNEELSNIFHEWNKGELNSYLIEITKDILVKKDSNNNYLIDSILDEANNKGTGIWTTKSALDFHIPLTLITESVFARYLSSLKSQRVRASKILFGPNCSPIVYNKLDFIEKVRQGLFLGKIISYAQGFSQLRIASKTYNWNLQYSEIARIFQSGCIIRAQFLKNITQEYLHNVNIINLLVTSYFSKIANSYQSALREIVSIAVQTGIAVPALSAAISYFDSYRSEFSPSNLIQAQRDLFGAHTYQRIDKVGVFHTDWYS